MTLTHSNESDQQSSSTVSITVLSVTPARAKKLFAFASVEINVDGVQIGVHGIRAMRELGGTAIELPKFRDAGGVWRTAITLPEEVHSPIAKAVFDELVERGLAVRRFGAMTAVSPDGVDEKSRIKSPCDKFTLLWSGTHGGVFKYRPHLEASCTRIEYIHGRIPRT